MQLGAYSFGDVQADPQGGQGSTGRLGSTADGIRNLFDAITLADEAGLDYFGVGEHHTREMPASAPATVLAAAGGATKRGRRITRPTRPNIIMALSLVECLKANHEAHGGHEESSRSP